MVEPSGRVDLGGQITRRRMIQVGISGLAATALAACSAPAAPTAVPPAPTKAAAPAAPTAAPAAAAPGAKPGEVAIRKASGKVTWAHTGWGQDTADEIVAAFKKAAPSIDFNLVTVPAEAYHDKFVTVAAAKAVDYDVIWLSNWIPEFAEAQFIQDVGDKVNPAIKADLLDVAIKAGTYKGKFYGLPWYVQHGTVPIYNTKMFADAGVGAPAKTWAGVLDQVRKIKEKGIVKYPIAFAQAQHWDSLGVWQTLVKNYGATYFDKDGNPKFTSDPVLLEVSELIVQINKEELINPSTREMKIGDIVEVMNAGDTALYIGPYYMMSRNNDPKQSKVAGNVDTFLNPSKAGDKPGGALGTAPFWGVPTATKNLEGALAFLEYLGGAVGNKMWAIGKTLAPAYKSASDDADVKKAFKGLDIWLENGKYSDFINDTIWHGPILLFYNEWGDISYREFSAMVTGQRTPKDFLKNIENGFLDLQKKNKR